MGHYFLRGKGLGNYQNSCTAKRPKLLGKYCVREATGKEIEYLPSTNLGPFLEGVQ